MDIPTSPFATDLPQFTTLAGVQCATACTGMRYDRDDVMLMVLPEGTSVAGVLTTNQLPGAPIPWCREALKSGTARALVVNAGVANVMTGKAGEQVVADTASTVAAQLGVAVDDVFVSSTGVIGEPVDLPKLQAAIPTLADNLSDAAWDKAARAIMTTDTFAKGVVKTAMIGNETVTIQGFIKGSGMVEPNMATMLGYVVTDAKVPADVLQAWLNEALGASYHAITVDSDSSTSDTVLCFATGVRDHWDVTGVNDPAWQDFREQFTAVHQELAKLVVKDGEGASKFVEVQVRGAENVQAANLMAKSIANSPLVKTAIAAEDANWGRIAMAAGKAGEQCNPDKTCIWVGPHLIALDGAPYVEYVEAEVAAYMQQPEVTISIDVGVGEAQATVWTCDLTHGYISINADYRS